MMSFRKRNSKVVVHNHINEIDYDKLAEAMAKAQDISEAEENKKRKFTSGSFATLTMIAFYVFSILVGLLSVLMMRASQRLYRKNICDTIGSPT